MMKTRLVSVALWVSTAACAGNDVTLSKVFDECMDTSGGVTLEMLNCTAAESERQD